jgi:hypothetical protein
MCELAVVMDLSRKIGVVLLCRFQHHLDSISVGSRVSPAFHVYLGAIGKLVRRQVHFSEAAFANEASQGVVAHRL